MAGAGTEDNSSQQIRDELESVCSSAAFARSPNLTRILRYVCEWHLKGRVGTLKEYSVAVDALGRPSDFATSQNSIVRVEVTRLRKRLKEYYAGEGVDHKIQIALPDTGYAPEFRRRGGSSPSASGGTSRHTLLHFAGRIKAAGWWVALLAVASVAVAISALPIGRRMLQVRPPGNLQSAGVGAVAGDEIRIRCGYSGADYYDRSGQRWLGDRYFTRGEPFAAPARQVLGTLDADLYQCSRMGSFAYDIPVKPGSYELHLHFAELSYGFSSPDSDGQGQRRFNVSLNGQPLLNAFDIVADAGGPGVADERVFKDVRAASDGRIHLEFSPYRGMPSVSGIELIPTTPGYMRPVRIVAGTQVYVDEVGRRWAADRYFLGGRTDRLWSRVAGTPDSGLYTTDRWGHFRYAIPVAEGRYTVTFKFAERRFGPARPDRPIMYAGGGVGSRVFNVFHDGSILLENFDIFRAAGGDNRAVDKTFRGLRPNAQGKLVFWFVPVRDYPSVCAIEVTDGGPE